MSERSDPLASTAQGSTESNPAAPKIAPRAFEVGGLNDVRWLRHHMQWVLADLSLAPERVADLVVAVSEVATNAVVHGRPPVEVRMWSTSVGHVCAVTDHGPGFDDALAGHAPAREDLSGGGMGLWLARQLCDELTASRTGAGFTVVMIFAC